MIDLSKSRKPIILVLGLAAAIVVQATSELHAAEAFVVKDTTTATHAKTGVQVVKGIVELPRDLIWSVAPYGGKDGLIEIYFALGEDIPVGVEGTRGAKLNDRRVIRERRQVLNRAYYRCRTYAREHSGSGPANFDELKQEELPVDRRGESLASSGIHLIPAVPMMKQEVKDAQGRMNRSVDKEEPLLVDTTPAIDDGHHWIITNRGTAERVAIDPALVKKLGVKIVPQAAPHGERLKNAKSTRRVTIYARVIGDPGKASITIRDQFSKQDHTIEWDTAAAKEGDAKICDEWAEQRVLAMSAYLRRDAPLSRSWAERMVRQYGLEESIGGRYPELLAGSGDPRFRGRTTNIMGMLGGRAAIQETLQLRNLRIQAGADAKNWMPSVPIDEIAGVKVAAHPFEEMLDGKPGGNLSLAEWIPHDHFMAYLPQPEKIYSLLGGGSDFIFNAGANATGRSVSYQLKDRYRDGFGLSEELMKRFLNSGAIEEMAVTIPDLFLIDGTEMSVVMRTGKPLLTTAALALVGIPPGDGRTEKKNRHGESVYWWRRGSIVILSTSADELDRIVQAKDGGNNLGRSAELRYMLTQVPITEDTVAYGYFSDPFIRHLVGPKAKIGQMHRLMARAELEEASAGALLAKFDGHGARSTDLSFLSGRGYMQEPVFASDIRMDELALSRSDTYGTAARPHSLTDLQIERVSQHEKEAYEQYLEEYERYWRRYFDPIAVRYEQKAGGQHEVETFILPLIQNSLYAGLREFLPSEAEQVPLRVPVLEPAPIALVSCNLNEDTWLNALEGLSDPFSRVLGLDPALLDLVGPDVHLALQDADPIITLGNGELQGMLGNFGGEGSEMMMVTVLVSVITRPCTVHIGLQDPDEVRKLLSQMAWAAPGNGDLGGFGVGSLYQITGEEKWIYKYTIEGVITFRFGIEVQDRYLVINNLPFSNQVKVTGNKRAPNSSAYVELNPAACLKQLPALFTSAAENMRTNTISGAACLMPLVAAGADLDSAQKHHRALFGFAPIHPGGGSWRWDPHGGMVSSLYGSPWDHRQPGFDPDNKAVGLLQGVSNVNIGMQFEQDGLRSKLRWSTAEKVGKGH